ncbi:hypothetical protein L1887_32044 [Cichorium endivia]|nr:hypothetical protein L1887_32044 [Cichorium endivia]
MLSLVDIKEFNALCQKYGDTLDVNIAKYRREDVTVEIKIPLQNNITSNHTYTLTNETEEPSWRSEKFSVSKDGKSDEEGWSEDFDYGDDDEEEEEDGISGTWVQGMYDMREGKFLLKNMEAPVVACGMSLVTESRKSINYLVLGDSYGSENKETEADESFLGRVKKDDGVNFGGDSEHGLPRPIQAWGLMGRTNNGSPNNDHYDRDYVSARKNRNWSPDDPIPTSKQNPIIQEIEATAKIVKKIELHHEKGVELLHKVMEGAGESSILK